MADALERLRNKNRPTVPSRDASLAPASTSTNLDIPTSRYLEVDNPKSGTVEKLSTQEVPQSLETKQTTLRFEKGMSDRLQDLCRDSRICREVLIEAMFEYCEGNQEALQAVLVEAKVKNDHRQQIANQKRAKSMMERFG